MEPQMKSYRSYISSRKVTPGTHLNSDSSSYCNVTDTVDSPSKKLAFVFVNLSSLY